MMRKNKPTPGLQLTRAMDYLCHSRSNALLRSWHTLCYSCGIRLATTVAYVIGMV
ncbi:MAG: hypothetical protein J6B92_03520 [Paraprevotella sp.]|nr:hypothetical protein [Paraprevotella sp.]MBP3473112.1 hypothetical protein [Paraprevotella sp.]